MRGTLFALTGLLMATGCSGLPEVTRTAVIHEVKLAEHMEPADLTVAAGDEVRWVNQRMLSARVEIPGLTKEMLSCDRGFTNVFGSVREVVELDSHETASLCFAKGMVISYNARMKSAGPGGIVIEPGTIRVTGLTQ